MVLLLIGSTLVRGVTRTVTTSRWLLGYLDEQKYSRTNSAATATFRWETVDTRRKERMETGWLSSTTRWIGGVSTIPSFPMLSFSLASICPSNLGSFRKDFFHSGSIVTLLRATLLSENVERLLFCKGNKVWDVNERIINE